MSNYSPETLQVSKDYLPMQKPENEIFSEIPTFRVHLDKKIFRNAKISKAVGLRRLIFEMQSPFLENFSPLVRVYQSEEKKILVAMAMERRTELIYKRFLI
ncbi:hypothetical protein NPIL_184361 [Nephila pilipes]|uniref:Uncharacterized protein n=1 Tax=Nephila pilipes TaxID=299642 RepID=A0A8X6NZU0_NEPPI|nr:hypothetical protein NPIL_185581 [Nephila pilipes]GFT43859.1 hypothetical protein NPIL_184361 [Nephila pilipes]